MQEQEAKSEPKDEFEEATKKAKKDLKEAEAIQKEIGTRVQKKPGESFGNYLKRLREIEKGRTPKKKSWGDYFTEPFETLYVLMEDKTLFKYTNREEKKIDLGVGSLKAWLKRTNKVENTDYGIKDITMILHNHLKNSKFSDRDYKQYERLKKYGFKGRFLLYSNITKKIYSANKEEK